MRNRGGGVYKQRLRRSGQGKSGGFRAIILLRWKTIGIFVFGFAKNERANITPDELKAWRVIAKQLLTVPSRRASRHRRREIDRGSLR
jgi:hypothetical protein